MKLSGITLTDFRGVSQLEVTLDPRMTVIVGRNGTGKSSVLDALAIMLTHVQSLWLPERVARTHLNAFQFYKKSDVQIGRDDYTLGIKFVLEDAIGEDVPLDFDFRLSDTHFLKGPSSLDSLRGFVGSQTLLSGKDDLLVYYRQDRGFDDKSGRIEPTTSLFGSLRAISQLESWWDRRDAEEARHVRDVDRNYRDPQLQAVRSLIKEVDGFVGVSFSSTLEPEGIYFEREDGVKIHVSSLSTGERSFIILLADLARRLQMTKPHLPLHKIPAIVLIDEIELNLHPSWQSKIISTLSRVFQSCQFIVTTHSPQVISSVESTRVRMLERDSEGVQVKQPLRTKGQTSNYLLEGVFQAHERDPEIDNLFDDFNEAVSNKESGKAAKLLDEIIHKIEGDPPELLLLRKRLKGIQHES